MKKYKVSKELVSATTEFLAGKPYVEVNKAINVVAEEMEESLVLDLLNFIARYPYREVAALIREYESKLVLINESEETQASADEQEAADPDAEGSVEAK